MCRAGLKNGGVCHLTGSHILQLGPRGRLVSFGGEPSQSALACLGVLCPLTWGVQNCTEN